MVSPKLIKYILATFILLSNVLGTTAQTIDPFTLLGKITSCQGTPSAAPNYRGFQAHGNGLIAALTISTSTGFEVSLNQNTGFANTITIPRNTANSTRTPVYIRSAANAMVGNITGTITLSSQNATTRQEALEAKIFPVPGITAMPDVITEHGRTTELVNLMGSGIDYYWSNNTPGIGLAAKGYGNIPSFTAQNNTSAPITATITATPVSSGLAHAVSNAGNNIIYFDLAKNRSILYSGVQNSPIDAVVAQDNLTSYSITSGRMVVDVTPYLLYPTAFSLPYSPSRMLLAANDTRLYISSSSSGYVMVFNTVTRSVITSVQVGAGPLDMVANPNGQEIYVANRTSNSISVINAATNTVTNTITAGVGSQPTALAVNADGTLLFVGSRSPGAISVFRTSDYSLVKTFGANGIPAGQCISDDGTRLYVSVTNGSINVFDTATDNIIATIPLAGTPSGLALSKDGNWLYAPDRDDNMNAITTADNVLMTSASMGVAPVAHGKFINGGVTCGPKPIKFNITIYPAGTLPEINANGTPTALTTVSGTASVATSFFVEGSNLTSAITVTPPTGFEISPDNQTFTDVLTLGSAGNLSSTTVFIRLKAGNPAGSYPGSVTLTSPGAANVNVMLPTGTVSQPASINAGTISGTVSACQGTPSSTAGIQSLSVNGSGLSGMLSVSAPVDFEISLDSQSGFSTSLTISPIKGTVNTTLVYVRAAANNSPGAIAGQISVNSPGFTTQQVSVTGTINPLPIVNTLTNLRFINGDATTAITFTGTASDYRWTNDKPAIGLPASGTGDIPSFAAVNTGNVAVTATITVTPINSASGCDGNPVTFNIEVAPSPITPVGIINAGTLSGPLKACVGAPSTLSDVQNFSVSALNLTNDLLITAPPDCQLSLTSGSGFVSSLTLTPIGGSINSTTIHVRAASVSSAGPVSGDIIVSSTGVTAHQVAVYGSINALPIVNQVANQQLSAGSNSTTITFSGTATNYRWLNNRPEIGLPASGNGNLSSFRAINTGNAPITANITVIPQNQVTGCDGAAINFNITVTPISPAIIANGVLTSQNTVYGSPSQHSVFYIDGINISQAVTVSAPAGFEISSNQVSFAPQLILLSPNNQPVYIRLSASTAVGDYSGIVQITSAGANQVNMAVPVCKVTPAKLTISAIDKEKIYGVALSSQPSSTEFSVSGLQNGDLIDRVTVAYGNGASAVNPAGIYQQAVEIANPAGPGFDIKNYQIQYQFANLIVKKAPLIIVADDKTTAYRQAPQRLTASYRNFVNNDSPQSLIALPQLTTTATINSLPGKYPINVSGAQADNYDISYVDGTLTITPLSTVKVNNVFTPNNDGINDTWNIPDLVTYPNCEVYVFTRSGKKIFSSLGYKTPWDGKYNNAILPIGTYYYLINLHNGAPLMSGYITIIK